MRPAGGPWLPSREEPHAARPGACPKGREERLARSEVRAHGRGHELLRRFHLRGVAQHHRPLPEAAGGQRAHGQRGQRAGEFIGYNVRFLSGRSSDRTGRSRSGATSGRCRWCRCWHWPGAGSGSLVLGRVFDRAGIGVLIPLAVVTAVYAPLVFLGGFWAILAGPALWGLGMGVQESLIPAAGRADGRGKAWNGPAGRPKTSPSHPSPSPASSSSALSRTLPRAGRAPRGRYNGRYYGDGARRTRPLWLMAPVGSPSGQSTGGMP
jgi:hypothetical protein